MLNLPEEILLRRNNARPDRDIPEKVVHEHYGELQQGIMNLKQEGFDFVYIIDSLEQIECVEIVRTKL